MIQKNEAFESDIRRQLKSYMDSKDWGVFLTWNVNSYIQSVNYLMSANVDSEALRMIALPMSGWPVVTIAVPMRFLPKELDNSNLLVWNKTGDDNTEEIVEAFNFWLNNPVRFKG